MNRYFLVALLFAALAIGGVVLFGLGALTEPVARGAFGVGFLGASVTIAVGLFRKSPRRDA